MGGGGEHTIVDRLLQTRQGVGGNRGGVENREGGGYATCKRGIIDLWMSNIGRYITPQALFSLPTLLANVMHSSFSQAEEHRQQIKPSYAYYTVTDRHGWEDIFQT